MLPPLATGSYFKLKRLDKTNNDFYFLQEVKLCRRYMILLFNEKTVDLV